MRVLQTSLLSPWDPRHGGGQLSVHDLSTALAERGHDVVVLFSGKPPPETPTDLAYRPHFVAHHERLYLNPVEFARGVARLARDVDVIHCHGYEGAFHSLAARGRAVTVATSRHPDPPDLGDPPAWLLPHARLAWCRRNVISLLERRALRGADLVVCVSRHSERVLREASYLSEDQEVVVAHNGGRPPVEPDDLVDEAPELLCIARLDEHKGIDVLLRALALMERKATLDLVGAGWKEGELRELAAALDLESRVRFRGYQEPARVAALQAGARVIVLPSRSENFPRVVLDALQQGKPLVTTAVGGIPEAVRHEREALLVPPDDPEALARALDRILGDDALREALARAAGERAAEFTWARTAEKVEAAYGELLDG